MDPIVANRMTLANLSSKAKCIVLYLSTKGPADVSDLKENLGFKLLELYSILKRLRSEGIVEQLSDEVYQTTVSV